MNDNVKKETIRMINNLGKFLPILVFIIPGITYSSESTRPVDENGGRPTHQTLLEKYDADGDGALSEQEKETLRKAMRAHKDLDKTLKRQARLQRFDTDGDGVLSDEEKKAFRKDNQRKGKKRNRKAVGKSGKMRKQLSPQSRQERLERFDTDGDGVLSDDEKSAARDAMKKHGAKRRQHMLERFDTDGDGQLSENERKAARQARKNRKNSGR